MLSIVSVCVGGLAPPSGDGFGPLSVRQGDVFGTVSISRARGAASCDDGEERGGGSDLRCIRKGKRKRPLFLCV